MEASMADLLANAFVGSVLDRSLQGVQDVRVKIGKFKHILKRVKSELKRMRPMIEEIEDLKRLLDTSPNETEMFVDRWKTGEELVNKCKKVRWWNFWKMRLYAEKLLEFEESLGFIESGLTFARDTRKIRMELEAIGGMSNGTEFFGACEVPQVPDFVVGFDEPLQKLKVRLLTVDEQVVVISAPGGCGKTTLAKMTCHDENVKAIFKDNIFFVTFSKTPSIRVIIEKLFQSKQHRVPNFQTDEEAFNQLESLLKKIGSNPILLVLDDVWSGSESLIEKFKFQLPKYKILVTSRSVFPRFYTYNLKLLNDQDASTLFNHSAFLQRGNSCIPDNLVDKVVKCCGRFPLALQVVGRSLCGKPECIWTTWLKRWSEKRSIISFNQDLLICLQTSLDSLDEMNHIKDCYLDLAAFPEDKRIPVTALIDMWVELYHLDEYDGDVIANLYELANRNLVNLLPTRDLQKINGYYNEQFVMQHDLLRELTIHQSNQNPIEQNHRLVLDIRDNALPNWWIGQNQHPIHARLLSITTDEVFSSNWSKYNKQLPMVEVLVLNIQSRKYSLPEFSKEMDQLKVLIITNYGFCSAEISNFIRLGHLSSLKRIRLEHILIPSISKAVLQLKNLQKVSFVMCKIEKAFQNCTVLIPNMLPNLAEIVFDYCRDLEKFPAWLCNISSLQKIYITNCNEFKSLPEECGELKNLEVLSLNACTKLLKLPESIGSLKKLSFLDLTDCISITKLPGQMGRICSLEKLHMKGCQGLSELPSSVKDLKQLKTLVCDEETAHLWEQYKIHLPNLNMDLLKEEPNLDWLHDMLP
ncbi:hypothetical protein NMG60_11008092 [Bertholletia excelsa]